MNSFGIKLPIPISRAGRQKGSSSRDFFRIILENGYFLRVFVEGLCDLQNRQSP
jgi:hypothetical protein